MYRITYHTLIRCTNSVLSVSRTSIVNAPSYHSPISTTSIKGNVSTSTRRIKVNIPGIQECGSDCPDTGYAAIQKREVGRHSCRHETGYVGICHRQGGKEVTTKSSYHVSSSGRTVGVNVIHPAATVDLLEVAVYVSMVEAIDRQLRS